MRKKKTKITELVISDENQELAIDAISLVSDPAIQVDFIFFGRFLNNLSGINILLLDFFILKYTNSYRVIRSP